MTAQKTASRTGRPTISFDLDGVLMQNPFGKGVIPFLARHVHQQTRQELDFETFRQQFRKQLNQGFSSRTLAGKHVDAFNWDAIMLEVAQNYGLNHMPDVSQIVKAHCTPEYIHLLPGAKEGLQLLKDAGLKLIVATNGYARYQVPVLDALGILPFFDEVRAPETHGYAKPQPELLSGADLHIGDKLCHDILAANRAGIQSIWIHPEAKPIEIALEEEDLRRLFKDALPAECTPSAIARDALEAAEKAVELLL
ncbi:HAD family hydrolase [Deinococcus roseus]|uniref:Hydrolase n=1 Tax=Deinococcus roseus TaxID=392414 RepID=A0ABQ2CVE3_9DEIO|nr:HAD family hydrolase [Deinococcus roseus]GGJ23293.1 hydrolase [Deinococcus roseus]